MTEKGVQPPSLAVSRRALLASIAGASATGVAVGGAASAQPAVGAVSMDAPAGPFTVFRPPPGTKPWGVKYARVARLPRVGGAGPGAAPRTLVATCENLYDAADYAYPVFTSSDDGRRWHQIGKVQDPVTGVRPRWQPFLYTLPAPFAGLPRGALLCAGNTIPDDFSSTQIDVLASVDVGRSWRFLSTVAVGGPPVAVNGQTPVWEPFLLLHAGRLICYYSDQRDGLTHGQKLAHQVSTDLRHWGPVVDDVADPDPNKRPGMPTVARLPHGHWIMTYEDGNNTKVSFGVAYRIAENPEAFATTATPHLVRSRRDVVPVGSPTVTWVTGGGAHGTIVVSSGTNDDLFINSHRGDGRWDTLPSLVTRSYSRQVQPWDDGAIMTIGGGVGDQPPPSTVNTVQFGLDALPHHCR